LYFSFCNMGVVQEVSLTGQSKRELSHTVL
jgi:hypothetical protein